MTHLLGTGQSMGDRIDQLQQIASRTRALNTLNREKCRTTSPAITYNPNYFHRRNHCAHFETQLGFRTVGAPKGAFTFLTKWKTACGQSQRTTMVESNVCELITRKMFVLILFRISCDCFFSASRRIVPYRLQLIAGIRSFIVHLHVSPPYIRTIVMLFLSFSSPFRSTLICQSFAADCVFLSALLFSGVLRAIMCE